MIAGRDGLATSMIRAAPYFNAPVKNSSDWAMSAPAFDPAHHQIWYTDASEGFFAVQVTNDVWP